MPSLDRTSPANVSRPSAIHGRRQIGTSARRRGPSYGDRHTARASPSQLGARRRQANVSIRSNDSSASGSVVGAVTQTATPRSRSPSRSSWRFSSSFATTTSGLSSMTSATRGFLVPPTRGTSRSAGWVHQSVAPTSRPGAVTAIDSVSDGTSDTTRVTVAGTGTANPRSSSDVGDTKSGVCLVTTVDRDQVGGQRLHLPGVAQPSGIDAAHAANVGHQRLDAGSRLALVPEDEDVGVQRVHLGVEEQDRADVVEGGGHGAVRQE